MDITKIQKVLNKAVADYDIQSKLDKVTLVSFISVDLLREIMTPDAPAVTPRPRNNNRGGETNASQ